MQEMPRFLYKLYPDKVGWMLQFI